MPIGAGWRTLALSKFRTRFYFLSIRSIETAWFSIKSTYHSHILYSYTCYGTFWYQCTAAPLEKVPMLACLLCSPGDNNPKGHFRFTCQVLPALSLSFPLLPDLVQLHKATDTHANNESHIKPHTTNTNISYETLRHNMLFTLQTPH